MSATFPSLGATDFLERSESLSSQMPGQPLVLASETRKASPTSDKPKPVVRLRTEFPETWIWKDTEAKYELFFRCTKLSFFFGFYGNFSLVFLFFSWLKNL